MANQLCIFGLAGVALTASITLGGVMSSQAQYAAGNTFINGVGISTSGLNGSPPSALTRTQVGSNSQAGGSGGQISGGSGGVVQVQAGGTGASSNGAVDAGVSGPNAQTFSGSRVNSVSAATPVGAATITGGVGLYFGTVVPAP